MQTDFSSMQCLFSAKLLVKALAVPRLAGGFVIGAGVHTQSRNPIIHNRSPYRLLSAYYAALFSLQAVSMTPK